MIDALITLGQKAEARKAEIEQARVLPVDLVDELKQSGILRLWVAKAYGGMESDVLSLINGIQQLAYYNGGFAAPTNMAVKVDSGIQVSARWGWGSGTTHCTTVIGGIMIMEEGAARPTPAVALFEPKDVVWHDTWNTNGLKGTGSGDYEVKDLFVPDERWLQFPVMKSVIDSPLYRVSFNGALSSVVSAVALGLAHRALDEIKDLGNRKRRVLSRKTIAEKPVVQYELAEAEAKYRSAKSFLEQTAIDIYEAAKSGIPNIDQKNILRMAANNATAQSADVVNWCYRIGGGSTIWDTSKLQELHRDMAVLTQHGLVASANNEMIGKVAFGQEFNEWML